MNNRHEHLTFDSIGSFRTVCISSVDYPNVDAFLRSTGVAVYSLESEGVDGKETFLAAVASCFSPRDLRRPCTHWDAMVDFVWQEIMEQPENQVAILWKDVDKLVANHLQTVVDGLEFFSDLGRNTERGGISAGGSPVVLRIVLFGTGNSFQEWR